MLDNMKDLCAGYYMAMIMLITMALLLNTIVIFYEPTQYNHLFLAKFNTVTLIIFLLVCFRRIYKLLEEYRNDFKNK